jgi:DNA-binding response OmpR family regulator
MRWRIMALILVVSPQKQVSDSLADELSQTGLRTAIAPSVEIGLGSGPRPELIALDISRAHPQAQEELRTLKDERATSNIPVVALIYADDLTHLSTDLAVDDFLLLPLRPGEATRRVNHILKQAGQTVSESAIRFGDLIIDTARYEVTLGGELVELTYKEYQLLLFLAENAGQVCTREVLLDRVWGYDYFGGSRTVDVHVRRLRSKLEIGDHSFVETVRNVGYRFRSTD